MKSFITTAVVFTIVMSFHVPDAGAATIRVPQDYPTIQAGINAAAAGDTVLVADGIYTGSGNKNIEFKGKAITVMSEHGPESCMIDCQNNGRGFYFNASESSQTVLDGFTIINGYVTGGYVSNRGGGIRIGTGASPRIQNCIITRNRATGMGAGIYVVSNASVFENCMISENTGEGLYHDGSTAGVPLIVLNCVFESNIGTGLVSPNVDMNGCEFRHNSNGGAQCSGIIRQCVFDGNTGSSGGGLRIGNGSVKNCSFTNNMSRDAGGAVYCSSSSDIIIGGAIDEGNIFSANTAGAGADIFCGAFQAGVLDARYNTFEGNYDSDYYISPREYFTLTGSTSGDTLVNQDVYVSPSGDDANDGLTWNTAFKTLRRAAAKVYGTVENPVTIHVANGVYSPSATGECFPVAMADFVRIEGEDPLLTVLDAEFSAYSLVAWHDDYCALSRVSMIHGDGGVFSSQSSAVFQGCTVSVSSGTGMEIHVGVVELIDCTLSDNESFGVAAYNAGLVLADCGVRGNGNTGIYAGGGTVMLSGCIVSDNDSGPAYYGGGVSLNSSTGYLSACTVSGNTALEDGGGVFCSRNSTLTLANCAIVNNQAQRDGGGLAAHYESNVTVQHSTFTGNSAGRYRGAVGMMFDCILTVSDSIFWGDSPDEIGHFLSPDITISYSVVQGGYEGTGIIDMNPVFVSGPEGDYYLSQVDAGQLIDSPCLEAGSEPAADACFEMYHGTVCLDSMTTRTDEMTDQDMVDIGIHYFPDIAVTPTPAPTEIPTATPTPDVTSTPIPPTATPEPTWTPRPDGVTLQLNAPMFHGGEWFKLQAAYNGPFGTEVDLYVILDVMGQYWFYPDWLQDVSFYRFTISPAGLHNITILDFTWPKGDMGQADDIRFWGAMCYAGTTELLGNFDSVTFGYR